jgi:hypothetical protein
MGYAVLTAVRLSWFCLLQHGMTQKMFFRLHFYLEDGHNRFLRSVSNHTGEYTEYFTFVGTSDLRLRAYHVLRWSHVIAQLNVVYAVLSDTRHWALPSADARLSGEWFVRVIGSPKHHDLFITH